MIGQVDLNYAVFLIESNDEIVEETVNNLIESIILEYRMRSQQQDEGDIWNF